MGTFTEFTLDRQKQVIGYMLKVFHNETESIKSTNFLSVTIGSLQMFVPDPGINVCSDLIFLMFYLFKLLLFFP